MNSIQKSAVTEKLIDELQKIAFASPEEVKINHKLTAIKMLIAIINRDDSSKSDSKSDSKKSASQTQKSPPIDSVLNSAEPLLGEIPLNREQRRRLEKDKKSKNRKVE